MEEGREWEEGDGGTKKGRAGSRKRRVRKGLEGIHARTHTRTHARTYTAHTHAHTHTHIHTHTHTYTHPSGLSSPSLLSELRSSTITSQFFLFFKVFTTPQ